MIEKLETKNTFNNQPAVTLVLADKLNEVIDTINKLDDTVETLYQVIKSVGNEQDKKIDYIMENVEVEGDVVLTGDGINTLGAGRETKTLKELYKE